MGLDTLLHPRTAEIYGRWADRLEEILNRENSLEARELVQSMRYHMDLNPRPDGSGLDTTL